MSRLTNEKKKTKKKQLNAKNKTKSNKATNQTKPEHKVLSIHNVCGYIETLQTIFPLPKTHIHRFEFIFIQTETETENNKIFLINR